MASTRREVAYGIASLVIACGGTDSSAPDASVADSTVPSDASTSDTLLADASPAPDGDVIDAGADSADAGCSINVTAVASCQLEAGYFCFDYAGSGWNAANVATACSPDAGGTVVWDAACPTAGRIGSCDVGQGAYEFVERCYPPFSSNQCQGFCLIVDGGYCAN